MPADDYNNDNIENNNNGNNNNNNDNNGENNNNNNGENNNNGNDDANNNNNNNNNDNNNNNNNNNNDNNNNTNNNNNNNNDNKNNNNNNNNNNTNNNNNNNNNGNNNNTNNNTNNNNNNNNDNNNDNNNNNNSDSNNNNNNNNDNNNNNNNNNNDDNNNNNKNKKAPPPPPPPPPPPSPPLPPLPPGHHKLAPASSYQNHSSDHGVSNNIFITLGAVAVAGFMVFIMILCVMAVLKMRKRRRIDEMYYQKDNKDNAYSTQENRLNQSQPPPNDVHLKMPPPPSSGPVSSEYGWVAAPPPPPPGMTSSEFNSSAFSGPFPLPPPHPTIALGFNKNTFTYDELAAATRGFNNSLLLGEGGFGQVHKGVLPNGKEVAVKSLKSTSGQGEREFQSEVEIISRVHHRHLVSLVGYCIAGQRRLLVYEYIPNSSLDYHLYGSGAPVLNCSIRLNIALGAAKGFAYLHEDCQPRIIHRDIKAANILIDEHYEAKVADFGLAKLSTDTNTHVSTRVMGTFGYLAPEYASSGKLTEKSDVFSFGVLLLELITGRRPGDSTSDDESLIDWARPILTQAAEGGSYEALVDKRLANNYKHEEMYRIVVCSSACLRHSARTRPKMSQVVRALEGQATLDDLNGVGTGGVSSAGSSEVDLHS